MSVQPSSVREALGRIDGMRDQLTDMKHDLAPNRRMLAVAFEDARDSLGLLADMIEEELT